MKNKKTAKRILGVLTLSLLALGGILPTAQAAILFQDDYFADIYSDAIKIGSNDAGAVDTAIQFGADVTASENGNILWDISTNRFGIDHAVDITGGLTSDGVVDIGGTLGAAGNSPASSRNMLRKDSAPNTNAACTALGEIIINTTANRLEVCTTTGAAGVAVWSAPSNAIPQGTPNPLTCSEGDLFYNTATDTLEVCTAANVWTTAGPQDFEDVYAWDSDDTLTTSNGNFSIAPGTGEFDVTSTGLIDFNSATFTLDTTSTFSIDGVGASNVTTSNGALTLSTTGTGAVDITAADNVNLTSGAGDDISITSGDDILFDDAQLLAAIQLTNTATGWAATLTGGGIIDNINSFTYYTAGDGASNVGVQDGTLGNIFIGGASSNNVQEALANINGMIGSAAPNVEILAFDPEYPDTVIYRDGTNNNGTLTADYDSGNSRNYYQWTTLQGGTLQDIELKFRYTLPMDFISTGDFTFLFRTQNAVVGDNAIDVTVKDITDAATCGSSTGNLNVAWTTATIAAATLNAGCAGLSAGDAIEVTVKFYSLQSGGTSHWAQISLINHAYSN